MRINLLQGAFFPIPPVRGGAVEKIWYALARELAGMGHAVTQVSRHCDGLPARETASGVQHLRVRGHDTPASLPWLKVLDLLYTRRAIRALPPGDIVVTNTFWSPLLLRPRKHGAIYVHVARFPKGQMRLYRKAAALQTVSHPILEAIRAEVPAFTGLSLVVPNPVEVPSTVPPPESRDRVILYAGRVHPEKGLDLLLEAWALVPAAARAGWRLRVAGPWDTARGGGGEAFKQALVEKARKSGAELEFTGGLFTPGALEAELDRAAVFVYPSVAEKGETFGVAPLEALAHGCPVIVSGLACFRDFVAHGQNGLVFDHRSAQAAAEFAAALVGLMESPERRAAFATRGRETAAAFTVAKVAKAYEDSFKKTLLHANARATRAPSAPQ